MGLYNYFRKHKETGAVEPMAEGDVEVVEATAAPAPAAAQAGAGAGRVPDGQAELARFQAELAARDTRIADLEARDRDREAARIEAAAVAETNALIKANLILSHAAEGWTALHLLGGRQKAGLPLEGVDLTAALAKAKAGLVPHSLTASAVDDAAAKAAGVFTLPNGSKGSDVDPEAAGRESYRRHVASQRRSAPAD